MIRSSNAGFDWMIAKFKLTLKSPSWQSQWFFHLLRSALLNLQLWKKLLQDSVVRQRQESRLVQSTLFGPVLQHWISNGLAIFLGYYRSSRWREVGWSQLNLPWHIFECSLTLDLCQWPSNESFWHCSALVKIFFLVSPT